MSRPAEGGGSAPASGKDLKQGAEALTAFKKRVDAILRQLESSPASKSKVADQQVSRGSFSAGAAGFAEADGLFAEYNRVHSVLTSLSQTLSDQIEAMGIAVHGAHVGFNNLEDDVRRRFWEIQTRTEQRAEEARQAHEAKEKGKQPEKREDDKTVTR